MDNIKDKIKEMIVRRLKLKMSPQEIKDDTPLFGPNGLGLDSIDVLELVAGLQKEFGVVINDKAMAERILISVNTITNFIEKTKG